MATQFKAVTQKHYGRAMALSGKETERDRYIVSLVQRWPDDSQARPEDYEQLTAAQVKEVVADFRGKFEPEKDKDEK